jgi:hypothetical protein
MGLTEHESEWHNKELITLIVADVHNPVTPILESALVGEGLYEAGRVITCLSEVAYHSALAIDENFPHVGAVEIYVTHVRTRSMIIRMPSKKASASEVSRQDGRG